MSDKHININTEMEIPNLSPDEKAKLLVDKLAEPEFQDRASRLFLLRWFTGHIYRDGYNDAKAGKESQT